MEIETGVRIRVFLGAILWRMVADVPAFVSGLNSQHCIDTVLPHVTKSLPRHSKTT